MQVAACGVELADVAQSAYGGFYAPMAARGFLLLVVVYAAVDVSARFKGFQAGFSFA